jgi:Uma2 family endonuclease
MTAVAPRRPVRVQEYRYTVADLAAMPSEFPSGTVRYELDNGRLISMSPTRNDHGAVESKIDFALQAQGERRGLGKVRVGEVGIILWRNPDRVVGADAVFIANASLPIRQSPEGYLETIPELVVEVVSKNDTRAYTQRKVGDYLHAGVRVVWVADPRRRTITVHRRDVEPVVLHEQDVLTVEDVIPGFQLPVREALEE